MKRTTKVSKWNLLGLALALATMSGAVLSGCGGGGDDDDSATNATNAAPKKEKDDIGE